MSLLLTFNVSKQIFFYFWSLSFSIQEAFYCHTLLNWLLMTSAMTMKYIKEINIQIRMLFFSLIRVLWRDSFNRKFRKTFTCLWQDFFLKTQKRNQVNLMLNRACLKKVQVIVFKLRIVVFIFESLLLCYSRYFRLFSSFVFSC